MILANLQHVMDAPRFTLYATATFLSFLIFLFFTILIMMKFRKKRNTHSIDYEAISGDDVVTTQLDLARAYLEMDKKQSAKKILDKVIKQGNKVQKTEAKRLIAETSY